MQEAPGVTEDARLPSKLFPTMYRLYVNGTKTQVVYAVAIAAKVP